MAEALLPKAEDERSEVKLPGREGAYSLPKTRLPTVMKRIACSVAPATSSAAFSDACCRVIGAVVMALTASMPWPWTSS